MYILISNNKYTGKKSLAYEIRLKTFSHTIASKNHLYRFSGENPFVCKICCKRFLCNGSLNLHVHVHAN